MSVLGRKMFKDPSNRGARNMLKGMGGIMASSPELANAVQGYSNAGQVRIPGYQESTNQSTVIPDTISGVYNFLKNKLFSGGGLDDFEKERVETLFPESELAKAVKEQETTVNPYQSEIDKFVGMGIGESIEAFDEENQRRIEESQKKVTELEQLGLSSEELMRRDPKEISDLLEAARRREEASVQKGPSVPENIMQKYTIPGMDKEALPREFIEDRLQRPLTTEQGALPKELVEERLKGTVTPPKKEVLEQPESAAHEEEKGTVESGVNKIPDGVGFGETNAEKSASVEDLMKVFKDNAPEYEGMDKGMAIAKIGFAIAAGKDPNALVNIAEGLKEGVEDQIKDKARRDEFNRQVDLAALQYAVGEKSTIDAENRAVRRQIDKEGREYTNYVVGPGGTTYRGVKYKEGMTIPVLRKDIYENNVPENIMDVANRNALLTKQAAVTKANAELIKTGTLSAQEVTDNQEKYASAVKSAADSEIALAIGDSLLVKIAEEGENIFGVSGAIKQLIADAAKTGVIPGMESPDGYNTIEEIRADFDFLLQQLIPTTLAESQSANSISNRDVEFLITAFFGPGALTGGSRLAFVDTDPNVMAKRIQNAMVKIANAQRADFAAMNEVETYISGFMFAPGGVLAADTVLEEQKKIRQEKGFGKDEAVQRMLSLGEPIRVDELGRNVYKIPD